jgi:hypothetical protein
MNLISYLFVIVFYILGGFYINILMRRILSHLAITKKKTINTVSLTVASVLTISGVGLSTFAFLYFHK